MQKIKLEEIQHWTAIIIKLKKNMKSNRMILTLIQDKKRIKFQLETNNEKKIKCTLELKILGTDGLFMK